MRQTWCALLFAHWAVPAAVLKRHIPGGLELDTREGAAWIAVTPFRMEGVSFRPLPSLPYLSAFPELNVRTYVTREDRPGVWFFSLDAGNRLAAWAARRLFHLRYFPAAMSVEELGEGVRYRSRRLAHIDGARFDAQYRPTSAGTAPKPGTLEHWLTERYCLYAARSDGALYRAEIHHQPWPLTSAEASIVTNTMLKSYLAGNGRAPDLLHFADRLDVVVWWPERLV